MKKKIEIPKDVEVRIDRMTVHVKGSKGSLEKSFNFPRFNGEIEIKQSGDEITVSTESNKRKALAMVGTIIAHMKNMFAGVQDGYSYELKILYTHFPITVTAKGDSVEIKNFFGEKGLRTAKIAGSSKVEIEKDMIKVTGINVEEVGQTAANLERACKLKGRDRRIFQDGIFLYTRKMQSGREI